MNRHYETACIVNPTLTDDDIKKVIEQGKKTLTTLKGSDINIEDWGRKKLAYPIEKNNDGYYFFITYTSSADASKELERTLRLNEIVMRYQTVRLDNPAKPVVATSTSSETKTATVTKEAKTTTTDKTEASETKTAPSTTDDKGDK